MEKVFTTSEMDNSAIEELLELMDTRKVRPLEKVHNWGKMTVQPKYGESFSSWLMRQAWAFSITPKKLIRSEKYYWLIKENISLNIYRITRKGPQRPDILPISSAWENVLKQRGLNIGVTELQLDISKWFDLANEPILTIKRLKNYYFDVQRYCPLCWKVETIRYFKILWRLPFVIVCPEHGVELKEYCSSCGELLFSEKESNQPSNIIYQDLKEEWLINCRHCSHSLLQETIEEKPNLASLQKKILNTLLSNSDWAEQRGYLIFWHTYLTANEKQKPESIEKRLRLMDTILKRPLLMPNSKYYSQELLAEIERRLEVMISYLSGIPNKDISRDYGLTNWSLRTFIKEFLKGKPIDYIIRRQLVYRGKLGLDLAQAELREFKDKNGRLPNSDDIEIRRIRLAIDKQEWISHGIRKWNDLLRMTFGEVNHESDKYIGQHGLERTITELREFKVKNGRLPKLKDKGMEIARSAIQQGIWISYGIRKWNDLLRVIFGDVNIYRGKYVGKPGLETAITELREFKVRHCRLPTSKDKKMSGISGAIARKEWASIGIRKWNDLLMKTFGEVNYPKGKYIGQQGLEKAITELQEFKVKNGRLPKHIDKEMKSIQTGS